MQDPRCGAGRAPLLVTSRVREQPAKRRRDMHLVTVSQALEVTLDGRV
jgi:hypothetical protein